MTVDLQPLAKRMSIWRVALLAFAAMCVQDILSTGMVIFEARLNAPVSGMFDVLGYIAGLICAVLALDSIMQDGWKNRRSLIIIASVSAANFIGTYIGVAIGTALTHH